MGSANKRQRYNVTSSLIGWVYTWNDPSVLCQKNSRIYSRFLLILHQQTYVAIVVADGLATNRSWAISNHDIAFCDCSDTWIVSQHTIWWAPRQWEMALLCNDVSHWLGASLESACITSNKTQGSREFWWSGGLTHWDRVTHICVHKLPITGSDNGLLQGRRQAIIWTNDQILSIGPLETNVSEIFNGIPSFSFKKLHLKLSSAKWRPFCLSTNVLTDALVVIMYNLWFPLTAWPTFMVAVSTGLPIAMIVMGE